MRMVMKNKAEGTELFKDGNLHHAVQRWTKALGHTGKFFDVSDEDKAEIDAVKVSLQLNLAMAYMKLELWNKAQANAEAALRLQPDNIKGLYRHAYSALMLKDYDGADKSLATAKTVAPDDTSCARLRERLVAIRKRQRAKEAAMARKMFG